MSYVKRVLQPGEEVRYSTNLHWILYAHGILLFLFGCVVYWIAVQPWSAYQIWAWIAGLIYVLAVIALFRTWFRRWITEIAVTDRRIIYKTGFIRRRTFEMNLGQVESVIVNQSILGRLLDYGEIDILGTGSDVEHLHFIQSPITFRSHITAVPISPHALSTRKNY